MVLAYRNPLGAVPDDAFILLARRGGVQSDQSVPHIRVRDLGSGFMIHTAALNKQNEFFSSVYASPATLQINYQGGNSLAQGPWYVDTQMTNLSLLPLLVPRSPVPDLGCNSLVQGPWSVESVATLPQPALAIARPESCNQPQCSLWHCVLADQGCNSLVQGPWFCKSRSRCLAFESNFRFSPLVKSCFPVTDQGCNSLVQGPWSANSVALLQKPAVAARLKFRLQPLPKAFPCVLADQGCNSLAQGPWFCKTSSTCLAVAAGKLAWSFRTSDLTWPLFVFSIPEPLIPCGGSSISAPVCLRKLDFNPFRGQRVGEAKNPGPQQALNRPAANQRTLQQCFHPTDKVSSSTPDSAGVRTCLGEVSAKDSKNAFTLAVVNPTAVLNKEALVLKQADVVMLSETSAVLRAQRICTMQVRSKGAHCVWGPPVAPHASEHKAGESLRGCAAGVAIFSKFPARPAFQPLPPILQQSQRFVEAYLRVGCFHFRIITMYGWPANYSDAARRNEQLLQHALQKVSSSPVPTILGGDLNADFTKLPSWGHLAFLGYQELFHLWQQRTGCVLPPTCKGATSHDTVLVPPLFQELLLHARVDDTSFNFDAHAPLKLTFRCPDQPPSLHCWRLPSSFMQYSPDSSHVEAQYCALRGTVLQKLQDCQSRDELGHAFTTWAMSLEESIDVAIRASHAADPVANPAPFLPRIAKGRCIYRERKQKKSPATAPAGRHGDYAPPDEAVTVMARSRVRQARRLHTFCQGLAKARSQGSLHSSVYLQLQSEWKAIVKASGYPGGFTTWLLQVAHFSQFYDVAAASPLCADCFPPAAWLADVAAYVRYDCDCLVKQEAKRRQSLAKYKIQLDVSSGHSRVGYRGLRKPERPPLQAIPILQKQTVRLVENSPEGALYRAPAPSCFRIGCRAQLADHEVVLAKCVKVDEEELLLIPDPYLTLPQQATLQQDTDASAPLELHKAFVEYWSPIWLRDPAKSSLSDWESFMESLPPSPEASRSFELDMEDLSLWKEQIQGLKPGRAVGCCGFSTEELKWLPDTPLADLVQLFSLACKYGCPTSLTGGTVHTLAKVDNPTCMGHGRPITVLSTIYRLWSSVAARAILRKWASWLPISVCGSIPNRSSRDVAYVIEAQVEKALLSKQPKHGFSLDIIKCFNQLPRVPLEHLLKHLHFPEHILTMWMDFLKRLERRSVFHGDLGFPFPSTTGVPEGDPLSVVAQVAICWLAASRPLPQDVEFWSYVDNLSWLGDEEQSLAGALLDAQSFCESLKLPIDWRKSFAWSTSPKALQWWQNEAQLLVPAGQSMPVLQTAKDLGVVYRFRKLAGFGLAANRFQEGFDRLQRLQGTQRPLLDKARLIQTSVWPASMYGMEGCVPPQGQVDRLRTNAAQALIGKRHSASSYLALSALTPRVTDPEPYLLVQAVCTLQRMCHSLPEIGVPVLSLACEAWAEEFPVCGPATALATMFRKQDWVLQSGGRCQGPGNHSFHVLNSSTRQVRQAVRGAWLHIVAVRVRHRNGLCHAPVPCPRIVDTTLQQFAPGLQVHLAQSIVGGHMSCAAQAKWDPLQDKTCEFCGELDSKSHRILHCAATAAVRQPFQAVLNWMGENAPHWIHCPFATESESAPFLRLLWSTRRLQQPQDIRGLVLKHSLKQLIFFTDGTCSSPQVEGARHAAWAVLLYCRTDIRSMFTEWAHWKQTGQMPACFCVVAQGLVPATQTINRAETCALLQTSSLCQQCPDLPAEVWSDSKYALGQVSLLQRFPGRPLPLSCAIRDLCSFETEAPFASHLKLHKVKAHSDGDAFQGRDLLVVLGNHVVDEAAKQARKQDLPVVHEHLQISLDWEMQQAECLQFFFEYLHQLTAFVAPRRHQHQASDKAQVDSNMKVAHWMQLVPGPPLRLAPPLPQAPEWPTNTVWPQWYLDAFWNWCCTLQWAAAGLAQHRLAGISYLELLANFVLIAGVLPPIALPQNGIQGKEYIDPLLEEGQLCAINLREMIVTFQATAKAVSKIAGRQVWLAPAHHKLRCLDVLIPGCVRKGLLYRPAMQENEKTGHLVLSLLGSSAAGEFLRSAARKTRDQRRR